MDDHNTIVNVANVNVPHNMLGFECINPFLFYFYALWLNSSWYQSSRTDTVEMWSDSAVKTFLSEKQIIKRMFKEMKCVDEICVKQRFTLFTSCSYHYNLRLKGKSLLSVGRDTAVNRQHPSNRNSVSPSARQSCSRFVWLWRNTERRRWRWKSLTFLKKTMTLSLIGNSVVFVILRCWIFDADWSEVWFIFKQQHWW